MTDYSDIPGLCINHDIFLELLTHIRRQADVLALMSTCKTFWADGIKPVLAMGVIIRRPSALRSFCTFMLNDISVRAPLLRRLYLAIRLDPNREMDEDDDGFKPCYGVARASLSKDLFNMFVRVMEKTTNVEDLGIDWAEQIFDRDEGYLAAAVVALRHIRRMHVGHLRDAAHWATLGKVKSPLVELDLNCSLGDWGKRRRPRITVAAQYHARTLQKLTTTHGVLHLVEAAYSNDEAGDDNDGNDRANNDGDDDDVAAADTAVHNDANNETAATDEDDGSDDSDETWVTFRQVRALALRNLERLEDGVTTLYTMFPAIRHLEISMHEDNFDAEDMREDAEPVAFSHPWGVLDRMCGSVDALYGLGGFPAAKILEVYRVYADDRLLERLRTVISCALPNYLVLHIGILGWHSYDTFGIRRFLGEHLHDCLPFEGSNITHLAVNLDARLMGGSGREHLDGFIFLLEKHPIQFLIIRVLHRKVFDEESSLIYNGLEADEKDDDYVPDDWPKKIRSVFSSSVILPLMEGFPQLTDVVLEVQDYAYDHVVRGDGGVMQLDEATGRGILKTLGLGMSDGRI
ncbi:hypothetical protein C2E23DRAFT_846845 [Lenzites betulinus]|nr:hypothetical protein C2E23DRAFT_846845 [Lenzites betulinus]